MSWLFMRNKGRKYTFVYEVDRQHEEILRAEGGIFTLELFYLLEC